MRFTRPESALLGVQFPLQKFNFLLKASLFYCFWIFQTFSIRLLANWSGGFTKYRLNNRAKNLKILQQKESFEIICMKTLKRFYRQLEEAKVEAEERKTNWSRRKNCFKKDLTSYLINKTLHIQPSTQ